MKKVFLKWVYIVFIGILLAAFTGIGIQAFYAPPKAPEPTVQPMGAYPIESTQSAEQAKQQEAYIKAFNKFQQETKGYNKNVSIIGIIAAIVLLTLSVTLFRKITLMADGFLLGGILTELYSIFRGFDSGDDKIRFLVVTIGLVIALFLGYIKFIKTGRKRK